MITLDIPATQSMVIGAAIWRVWRGFNLYIDLATACNAACPFCIAETAGRHNGPGFMAGASWALAMTEDVKGTVQIVGGEPAISHRLLPLLDEMAIHAYPRAVVNTNGSMLTAQKLAAMQRAGVSHVNISRHHWVEDKNQEIMRFKRALPNRDIVAAVRGVQKNGMELRVNCNLIAGYVDSLPAIVAFCEWCAAIGCRVVSFSQIFPLRLFGYCDPKDAAYTDQVQVDMKRLVADIDASPYFRSATTDELGEDFSMWGKSLWRGGKRRYWHTRRDMLISIKTLSGYDPAGAPLPTEYTQADDPELQPGNLVFAVVHPDGRVTASWDRRERLLFQPAVYDADG